MPLSVRQFIFYPANLPVMRQNTPLVQDSLTLQAGAVRMTLNYLQNSKYLKHTERKRIFGVQKSVSAL